MGRVSLACRPAQGTRSAAAAPDNVIVIQDLLLTFTYVGVIRSAFLFPHIGEHFAIPPSRVVNDELVISRQFEFLNLGCEVFSELIELFHLSVGRMNLKPDTGLEDVCLTRSVRFRKLGIGAFEVSKIFERSKRIFCSMLSSRSSIITRTRSMVASEK